MFESQVKLEKINCSISFNFFLKSINKRRKICIILEENQHLQNHDFKHLKSVDFICKLMDVNMYLNKMLQKFLFDVLTVSANLNVALHYIKCYLKMHVQFIKCLKSFVPDVKIPDVVIDMPVVTFLTFAIIKRANCEL